jgi:ribosomal protein S10
MYTLIYTSLSKKALNSYQSYIFLNLKKYNLNFTTSFLPQKKRKKTVLKSPHVNKKSKETFEVVKYSFIIQIKINCEYLNLFKSNVPKLLHLKSLYIK